MKKKRCRGQCGQVLPVSAFYGYTNDNTDKYLSSKCKQCTKEVVKTNRKDNAEYYRVYELTRQRPAGYTTTASQKHRAKYPERYKARTAVNNAIRDKRLTKQPCMVCGSKNVEAHHRDYRKPLEVEWRCSKHHLRVTPGG